MPVLTDESWESSSVLCSLSCPSLLPRLPQLLEHFLHPQSVGTQRGGPAVAVEGPWSGLRGVGRPLPQHSLKTKWALGHSGLRRNLSQLLPSPPDTAQTLLYSQLGDRVQGSQNLLEEISSVNSRYGDLTHTQLCGAR